MLDRRRFLSTFSSLAAFSAAPFPSPRAISDDFLEQFPTKLPDRSLYESDEEAPPRRRDSGVFTNKEAPRCCMSDWI